MAVRCEHEPFWKIRIPVQIKVYDDVLVSARPLTKGQLVDENSVTWRKLDIATLNNGYFSNIADLSGMESKSNIAAGKVLTMHNLKQPTLVKPGQEVTMLLNYRGITIRSTGKALQAAGEGQKIKVRNSRSNKIVEGTVNKDGVVKIQL